MARWGLTAGQQLCREGPGSPHEHQTEYKPATNPHSKGGRQPSGLNDTECCQQDEGGDPFPLLSTVIPICGSVFISGLPRYGQTGVSSGRSHEDV